MNRVLRTFTFLAAALWLPAYGQTPPATILEIDYENLVWYYGDVADPAKHATSPLPAPLPATLNRIFKLQLGIADVVAVNGKPFKGVLVNRNIPYLFATGVTPGQAIADISGWGVTDTHVVIQHPDGTQIGSIMATGVGGMAAPPGAPKGATTHNFTIAGGTGAFLGVRGQVAFKDQSSAARAASMIEDPAYRRVNGGGKRREIFHLIPMSLPEVVSALAGPVVLHAGDFSPVSTEKPAWPGEWLVMSATNLGPTRPGIDPGKPFPEWAPGQECLVNSPLQVTVGGQAAEVRNAVGWPGQNNVYRVDFRVPEGVKPGLASLNLTVAWIAGPEVKIPVR